MFRCKQLILSPSCKSFYSLHPLPDDVVFHKVYTAVHTAISEMTRPSLIPPALFSLTRLHLTRRHNHQLSTSLLGLLVAHLLDSSSSNANSTSMSNITLSFLNRLTRKDIMTWGEMKEAGDTLVRAVAKGGVGDGLIDVVKFLTARGLASFMLKVSQNPGLGGCCVSGDAYLCTCGAYASEQCPRS